LTAAAQFKNDLIQSEMEICWEIFAFLALDSGKLFSAMTASKSQRNYHKHIPFFYRFPLPRNPLQLSLAVKAFTCLGVIKANFFSV